MRKYWVILVAIIFFLPFAHSQTIIRIDVKNYDNDTLILGNYFGEKTLVKDTIITKSKGKFVYEVKDSLAKGVYLILLKPNNDFFQFIANGIDKEVHISVDSKVLDEVNVKGSNENLAFYNYMKMLKNIRPQADSIKARMDRAKVANKDTSTEEKELSDLDKKVQKEQRDIIDRFPGSILALLLKANIEPTIPEFEGDDDEKQKKRYWYYKNRYFDNVDFFHPAILRTPFLYQRVNYYLTKLTPQSPDSIIIGVDYILKKVEHNPEMYRYFLADFLNKYAQLKIVGHDALYVHLVDKYYSKGKAHWVDEETLQKMKDNADDLRPVLIGKKMPDFTVYKEDNTPVRLSNIQSPYTIVFFWAPDCGHCKKITPNVVDFYKKYKDKNVKLLAVCTKGGDKTKTCWPAIKEKGMEDFINTGDEYQRFNALFKIKSTPKIFILDKDKMILLKDIPAEDIEKIFEEVLKVEEMKRLEKEKNDPVQSKPKASAKELPKDVLSGYTGFGTGFILDLDGYVATNYHVIENTNTIDLMFFDGFKQRKIAAKLIKEDKQNDIAILEADLSTLALSNLPYNLSFTYEVGDKIYTIGFPEPQIMGIEPKWTSGDINSLSVPWASLFQISAPIQAGNSGGPIFDSQGNIIGIIKGSIDPLWTQYSPQNVNYAIKAQYLGALTQNLPRKHNVSSNNIDIQKKYVCLILTK